jgi:hypothetical protein
MNCKICSNKTKEIFKQKVLAKYDIKYFMCSDCLFIQTEEPYWLEEAYNLGAISALDVGIISRNTYLATKTEDILDKLFPLDTLNPKVDNFTAIDYGGGQGIFVRMMRDLGYNFYRQDVYAENLYARFFDITDLPKNTKFSILTTFEVFEHLPNPIEEINKMFNYSDILLFSTELQPIDVNEIENWWYIVPETGQHISLFNKVTLEKIAEILDVNLYTDSHSLHILSKTPLSIDPFYIEEPIPVIEEKKTISQRIVNKISSKKHIEEPPLEITFIKRTSLTQNDFEFVKQKINAISN